MPAPTQRPRPIGSSSFTGDKPPPKRPRRQVRGTPSTSSNPPPPPSTERNRLDELLDRFLDISRPASSSSTPQSGARSLRTSTASTTRSNLSGGSMTATSSRTLADRTNGLRPVGTTRSLPYMKGGAQELRATKSAPRPVALAGERPVRSSPRRPRPVHSVEASPLRALAAPLPLEPRSAVRTPAAANQQPLSTRAAAPPRRTAPLPSHSTPSRVTRSTTVPNAGRQLPPQPSSDGDTSIDSLDMAFECGGEDVDRLFQMMDGGR